MDLTPQDTIYNIGRIIFSLAIALIFAAGLTPTKATAQNLNPTVEVTNEYQAKTIEVNKPLLDMAVPDTVMRFQLDFDYSIAPNPYKGSYSFTPYVINVQPESYAEKARTLYLRVGAGYSLHPTVDIVFTPRFKTDKFSMSIYGTHRSYIGKYRSIGANDSDLSSGEKATLKWDRSKFSGYNAYTNAGIYGRADWNTGLFSFDVGYTGYARRDSSFKRSFDMLHAKIRVASRKQAQKYFFYDFSASYLYGTDAARTVGTICPIPCTESRTSLNEQDFCFNGILGPVFSSDSRLLFDVRFDLSEYTRYFD
ncbi:MAG: hypothetical protein LUC24_02085, partial [Bacteroidales bacterium]|nr:hypothetical protein [Bacteroidales bacterium]